MDLSGEGYFREEDGRTYKWLEDAPERLIYDFHFGIGDSLPGADSNQATRYVVQTGAETLSDGVPRKAVIFNSVCGLILAVVTPVRQSIGLYVR